MPKKKQTDELALFFSTTMLKKALDVRAPDSNTIEVDIDEFTTLIYTRRLSGWRVQVDISMKTKWEGKGSNLPGSHKERIVMNAIFYGEHDSAFDKPVTDDELVDFWSAAQDISHTLEFTRREDGRKGGWQRVTGKLAELAK